MRSERKRVLVVDDDDSARDLLTSLLATAGYDVCGAVDGIDALDRLASRRFDAMITDYHMPRLNGLQLWAVSRKLWPALPVVLLSADAALEAKGRPSDQPFASMRKPYGPTELLCVVRAACGLAPAPLGSIAASPF